MNTIFDVLNELKKKPELFLGNKQLSSLYQFINGYLLKCTNTDDNESLRIRELHSWIKIKLNSTKNNWCEIILENSNHDKNKALKDFFKFLEEFKSDKNISF